MVLFQVLGPLEVRGRDGVTGRPAGGKPATVLAALLVQPNAWVAVDRLIENTWQEQDAPASAEANLKTYMWQLRRLLPEYDDGPRIEGRAGAYRLRVGPGELDADHAEALAADARAALPSTPGRAFTLAEQALGLWRGRPFEGLDIVADDAVQRLGELHRRLRETLAEAQLGLGHTAEAVATLASLAADDPLREDVWAALMRAQHTMGRPAHALATFHRARRVLAAELGVRPGPELMNAFRSVHGEGATAQARPRRELPRTVEPLIGRDRELAALDRALTGPAPVAVVTGAAGAGKTALAVAAAHLVSERFPDGQFFVDLHGGTVTAAATLERLLRGIGFPPALIPSDVDERAALWRSELAGRRVLLVFDDVADRSQVAPLLPATGNSATLVTTRAHEFSLAGARSVRLERAPAGRLERVA